MSYFQDFWSVLWTLFWMFAFVAYLITLFSIVQDLFRDRDLRGIVKAIWLVFLFFLPFLTALIYLIARGDGMARRAAELSQARQAHADDYIRGVAGNSPSEEIAKAKALLEAGTITPEEYENLKAAALGSVR